MLVFCSILEFIKVIMLCFDFVVVACYTFCMFLGLPNWRCEVSMQMEGS
jgi:hypothetical protein